MATTKVTTTPLTLIFIQLRTPIEDVSDWMKETAEMMVYIVINNMTSWEYQIFFWRSGTWTGTFIYCLSSVLFQEEPTLQRNTSHFIILGDMHDSASVCDGKCGDILAFQQ
jgi:hypothetical protein